MFNKFDRIEHQDMPKSIPYYWGEGQPKAIRFSYEDSLGGYLHMYKIILDTLEKILEAPIVVEPDDELNTRYVLLLEYFYSIHTTRTDFKHIPDVRFDKFASLIQIDQKFIQAWKEEKPEYIELLRIIDGQFKSLMYGEHFKIPRNLFYVTDSLASLLSHHQESAPALQEKERPPLPPSFTWETGTVYRVGALAIEFTTARDNVRRTIFKMLTEANGEPVKVHDIERKVHESAQKVRIIISQLKDKIKNTNLTIQTDRKGAYFLSLQE